MDRRRQHHIFRSLRKEPSLDKVDRKKTIASLQKMYLETKIRMLEIIQEELQLKLEMHCVKEQFLGLLENYTTYDDGRRPPHATRYIPAEYAEAYYNPEHQVIPRSICRCHERANKGGNMHGSYIQHAPQNVQCVQNSSSSSDEHNRLVHARNYPREQVEHRVPPMTDYEQHVMQYQQPQVSPTSVTSSEENDAKQNGCHISASRARVRAFYANRRERILAQRARHGYVPQQHPAAPTPTPAKSTTSYSPGSSSRASSSDMDTFVRTAMHHFERNTNTPVLSVCSSSDSREKLFDSEDFRNNNTPPKSAKEPINSQTNESQQEDSPPYQNLLTPIREERSSSSKDSSGLYCSAKEEESPDEAPELPPRCPLIPTERYREYLSHKSPPDDLGEYVTLKAPDQSMNSFFDECQSQMAPSVLKPDMTTMSNAPFAPAMLSMSFMSDVSDRTTGSHREKDSPVRYAKSNVISELYTKRDTSLLDMSQISNISTSSIAPSSLSDSTLEHYPLHSTMIASKSPTYRAKQRISFSDDDSLLTRTDDTFETLDSTLEGEAPPSVLSVDSRTTSMSDPSAILRGPQTTQLSLCSKSYDDCYINAQTDLTADISSKNDSVQQTQDIFKTPKNPPRRPRRSDPPKQTKLEPTLCKEHGLHPVFGGSPCIFEDSQEFESDDSDLDFSSVAPSSKFSSKRSSLASKRSSWASTKLSSKRSSVARHNSVADTDCDSSYLSECVDDTHFTNDFSEPENYTAMYDSRRARMRFMRRQTGHANIKSKRHPIGLSESDILDSTQKHLSLHATRASMPDLHGLSHVTSYEHYSCDDLSESTLRNSPEKQLFLEKSSFKESDPEFDVDQDETIISAAPSERRPLSVCTTTTQATTTTDESPESQGGMTVPVNSPNITDSGGSSSRQPTTDDYVDVPVNLPKMAKMLESRLQSHAQYPEHGAYLAKHRARRRYPGSSAGSSQQSLGSKQSLHICSDPIPELEQYQNRSRTRRIYNKKYPHSQDSGFNTQDSRARARALQLYEQQHYAGHPGQIEFIDNTGKVRTVAKHSSVAKGLDRERKKALAKKLKQFNNNFYGSSSSSLQIKTLGHF